MKYHFLIMGVLWVLLTAGSGNSQFVEDRSAENVHQITTLPERKVVQSWRKAKRKYVKDVQNSSLGSSSLNLAPATSNYLDLLAIGPTEKILSMTIRVPAKDLEKLVPKSSRSGGNSVTGRVKYEYHLHADTPIMDAFAEALSQECILFYKPGGVYFGGISGAGYRMGDITITTSERIVEMVMTPVGFNLLISHDLVDNYFSFGSPSLAALVYELCHKDLGDEEAIDLREILSGVKRLKMLSAAVALTPEAATDQQ